MAKKKNLTEPESVELEQSEAKEQLKFATFAIEVANGTLYREAAICKIALDAMPDGENKQATLQKIMALTWVIEWNEAQIKIRQQQLASE